MPHTVIFRERRRPGPAGAGALVDYERDLADAALILNLMDKGALKASYPDHVSDIASNISFRPSVRLTEEEEVELTRRVQICADIDARNTLVMANIGLVHLVANQMCRPPMRYEDLLQEGIMGLMRATETYEPFRNVRFSTYSVYWIRAKIQRHIQRINKDDTPSIPGAAMQTDSDGKRQAPRSRKLSLDKRLDFNDDRTLLETLATNLDDPEEAALRHERALMLREAIDESIEELGDPRLHTLIKLRLLTDQPATLDQVGKAISFSREGVRMLEARLLKRVKSKLKSLSKVHG
jgi:RNA polymerase sigma factor (sigma-70 family)